MVGVSLGESAATVRAFAREFAIPFPLWIDPEGQSQVPSACGATPTRSSSTGQAGWSAGSAASATGAPRRHDGSSSSSWQPGGDAAEPTEGRRMMGHMGEMMGFGWMSAVMGTSLLMLLGLLTLVTIGVVAGIRWRSRREQAFGGGEAADRALEGLRERYARGEITGVAFHRIRQDLSSGARS